MLCKKPYMRGLIPCPCRQCMPCRINHRRHWTQRLQLERSGHENACFVTLTYQDEELKDVSGACWNARRPVVGTLDPYDFTTWLKRFRRVLARNNLPTVRYFGVGEYGDEKERPHYHVALFGFPSCLHGRTRNWLKKCCAPCDMVKRSWGKGRVDVLELSDHLAQYITGYVTKKWTKEDKWTEEKLKGRHPEFVRMSLNPGIGALAIKTFAMTTAQSRMARYVTESFDVPAALLKSGSVLPLGRYLKRKWREALRRDQDTPAEVLGRYQADLQKEFDAQKQILRAAGTPECFIDPGSIYQKKNSQKIKNVEARFKIHQQRRSL